MKFMDDENLSPSECEALGRDSRGRPLSDETTPTYVVPDGHAEVVNGRISLAGPTRPATSPQMIYFSSASVEDRVRWILGRGNDDRRGIR